MKFLVAYKKADKCLLKIKLDSEEEKWATCPQVVFDFAQKNIKKDEDIVIEYSEKNGQYYITKISSKNYVAKKEEERKTVDQTAIGTSEKKEKSEKIQNLIEPEPLKSTYTGYTGKSYYSQKSPEESEKIKRLSILSSTCEAVKVLTGHIDNPNTLEQIIESLYTKLYKIVSE